MSPINIKKATAGIIKSQVCRTIEGLSQERLANKLIRHNTRQSSRKKDFLARRDLFALNKRMGRKVTNTAIMSNEN